jgi:hypothetical protein
MIRTRHGKSSTGRAFHGLEVHAAFRRERSEMDKIDAGTRVDSAGAEIILD